MPIALDPKRTTVYVLKAEREQPEPTQFTLRALTARERADVADQGTLTSEGEWSINAVAQRNRRVWYGLTGWENFKSSKGTEIVFDPKNAARLDYLDDDTLAELSAAIRDLSEVTPADRD